jgi:hypothetical protein
VAHSGRASARISHSTGDPSGTPAFFISPTDPFVAAGQLHVARVWARGRRASGRTRIALAWFSGAGTYLGSTASAPLPHGTTTWRLLTVRARAPAGSAYVQIHLESSNNTGTVWFDDVSYR